MKFFFYYLIFRLFLGSPLLALFIIIFAYLLVDRQFIGLFPDIFKPMRRRIRIKELKEDLSLNPANANSAKELGFLYLEGKKYNLAKDYLLKALERMDDYPDVHFQLGKTYLNLDNKSEGLLELEKSVKINKKVGYGEPYVFFLEAELEGEKNINKIEELISEIKNFGTPEILFKAGKVLKTYDRIRAKNLFNDALESYRVIPKNFRKIHRRWAFLARLNLLIG